MLHTVKTIVRMGWAVYRQRPFDLQIKSGTVGAEIGVFRGCHAAMLCRRKPKTIYLIDPYKEFDNQYSVWSSRELEMAKEQAVRRVRRYNSVTETKFIEKISAQAAAQFAPGSLDFVYIDANHSYEGASEDISLWYDKVKKGGVFGGHDFTNEWTSVIKAVCDFAVRTGETLYIDQPDWWIIKGAAGFPLTERWGR